MASQGTSNNSIKEKLALRHETVKRWRDRYIKMSAEIKKTEAELPHKLRRTIESALSDEQRPGAPSKFSDEQVAAIIALSCEDPAIFGIPFSHWTPELLRIEAIKLGITESISVRQIGRFLKRERLKASPESVLAEP
jgi:putative transposase